MKKLIIDREWLEVHGACRDGMEFFLTERILSPRAGIRNLLNKNHFNWANWLLVRLLTHKQKVRYAVFAAEQVIKIYTEQYPNDDRPRKAIKAAKLFVRTGNSFAAYAAAYAANDAASAASAANAANAANVACIYLRRKIINYGLKLLAKDKVC